MPSAVPLAQRFWAKVDIGLGGKKGPLVRAHRLSWEMANGRIPDGMRNVWRIVNRTIWTHVA
jgi:hypothetical protein